MHCPYPSQNHNYTIILAWFGRAWRFSFYLLRSLVSWIQFYLLIARGRDVTCESQLPSSAASSRFPKQHIHLCQQHPPELGTCSIFWLKKKIESTYFFKPIPCNLFLCQFYLKSLPPVDQINLIKHTTNIIFYSWKNWKIPQVCSSGILSPPSSTTLCLLSLPQTQSAWQGIWHKTSHFCRRRRRGGGVGVCVGWVDSEDALSVPAQWVESFSVHLINPLEPRVYKIKSANLTLNWLLMA